MGDGRGTGFSFGFDEIKVCYEINISQQGLAFASPF
jgi:hypothetical protein